MQSILPPEDRPFEIPRPVGVRPEFYMDAVLDQAASMKAARPIYHDVERVKIIIPGIVTNIHVKNVDDVDRRRWPEEYRAFREGREQPLDGTPLEEWPILTKAMVEELKHWKIRTVEELAQLSDVAIQQIGIGGRALRDRAKAFLDDAERERLTSRLTHENGLLQTRVAVLEKQVNELGAILERIDAERRALAERPYLGATLVPGPDPRGAGQGWLQQEVEPPPSALDALAERPSRRRRGAASEELDEIGEAA